MNSIKKFHVLFFLLICSSGYAQTDDAFQERLSAIKQQLELMADSTLPGLKEVANFSVSNLSVQSFLRSVAESHQLNVQIDPALNFSLTNNFTNVQVKDVIYFVCEEYQTDIRFTNTIMSFFKYQPPKAVEKPLTIKKLNITFNPTSGLLSFDLLNDSLSSVVKEITRLTNRNVIAAGGPEIENKLVRGYIKDLPVESALDKLGYVNALKLNKAKDGVLILESAGATNVPVSPMGNQPLQSRAQSSGDVSVKDSLISVDVTNFPIVEIINQASSQLGINYIVFSEVTGNTSAKVKSVTYDDLLSFLFQGTNYTYKKKGNVYLLGQRSLEGFRTTELIKLDFRTTDGIEKEIPSDLLKDVELKIHKELNALIITGNKQKINEISTFVKLIDRPIPNIQIEVIVVDVRKGYSIETGLKAFLSDSVPKTSGQILGGVDLTLSSKSINNAFQELDSKGIVNLGRVTPNFYVQLQAMEQNNNIQVRSTPKLATMNGSKANLIMGESVYYVETSQNITGGVTPITTTTQRFNKVEANLSINISPIVSGNEHITLDITAEFSDFIPSTIQNAPPGNTTRKFESKIRVKNEEMIILGGLEELSKSDTGSGVPVLSRIPVLKWFFSSKSKQNSNNKLIVFIKPTIVY